MQEFEAKFAAVREVAKCVFGTFKDCTFCGGTSLNLFYTNYRYSEDLDIGYEKENPKSRIEELLRSNGYAVERTTKKIRDLVRSGDTEIKMDIFEYFAPLGTELKRLDNVEIRIPTIKSFVITKTVSFLTRENLAGMARDAYDLYALAKTYPDFFGLVESQRKYIAENVVAPANAFGRFNAKEKEITEGVGYLLKIPISYLEVKAFLNKLRRTIR